ncbi:hypothetical protein C8Q70DRAFT_419196 [Cubamyces menziesii]|nr:hypothetical protein C8Q70DRAFT_419196 [Cubamyces menziesii]
MRRYVREDVPHLRVRLQSRWTSSHLPLPPSSLNFPRCATSYTRATYGGASQVTPGEGIDRYRTTIYDDLYWLLLPYSNLRVLALTNVYWIGPPERPHHHWANISWPTFGHQNHLPQVRHLKLALGAHPHGQERDPRVWNIGVHSLAMRQLFSMFASSLEHLEITCRGFLCIVDLSCFDPETRPTQILCELPHLRRFDCYLRAPEAFNYDMPYHYLNDVVAKVPVLLNSIVRWDLREIGFYFSHENLAKTPDDVFLACLRDIHAELIHLMESSHFLRLEKFYLDIGLPPESLRPWVPKLMDCFPLLVETGILQIVPYIRPPKGIYGPFDDRLDYSEDYLPHYVSSAVGILPLGYGG